MKTLRKTLLILSLIGTSFMDFVILLSVATMTMNALVIMGTTNQIAWGGGLLVAVVAFAHLKYRHLLRRVDQKTVIEIKPIHNQADHDRALKQLDYLWGAKTGSKEAEQLEILMILVDDWEKAYFRGLMQQDNDEVATVVSQASEHPINFIKHGDEKDKPETD